MGRPRSENPKVHQVSVRLTPDEADALAVIELLDDVGQPELIRRLLSAEIGRRRRDPLFIDALRARQAARARRQGDLLVLPRADEGA